MAIEVIVDIQQPSKKRIGGILLAVSAVIIFFSVGIGMSLPFSGSPKPSTVVGIGVVTGSLLGSFGGSLFFSQLSLNAQLIGKRLAIAFGFVMIIHALFVFGPQFLIDLMPLWSPEMYHLSCNLLIPGVIYLIALYGAPVLSTCQAGMSRILRMAFLTVAAFGLSFASLFGFLGFWLVASIVFEFPFREGV